MLVGRAAAPLTALFVAGLEEREMGQHFKMWVEVKRDRRQNILALSQRAHIKQKIDRYGMSVCNPTRLPCTPKLNFAQDDTTTFNNTKP